MLWPLEDQYYTGTVRYINDEGSIQVHYDAGEVENINMSAETWNFSRNILSANNAKIGSLELASSEPASLQKLLDQFGKKSFLKHQAQGFPQFTLSNAYDLEESSFRKTVKAVTRSKVPHTANVISSNVIYKIKINDDQYLKLKDRIAPHGNEGSQKDNLKIDCFMCPPTGIRITV